MKTSVERIDDTTVKVSITVESARIAKAVDQAAGQLAREVKVPGFRPGKAPRRVLESRFGKGALLEQAARDALPDFYAEAVKAEELEVVGPPEFDVDTFEEGKDAEFSATVEVRPEFDLPDLASLQVPHPEWEVTDEDMEQQLDALRERFAELETVSRPVQVGDHVQITLTGARDGEPVEEASQEGVLYEVRDPEESDQELDRQLLGSESGAILKFTDHLGADYGELAGEELDFTVIVKEVKAKRLPELDDDFAITASEFDTIDELREAVAEQLRGEKVRHARGALRGRVVEAVTEEVEVALPKSMVSEEVRFRVSRIAQQAEQYGMELEQFLTMAGTSAEDLMGQMEEEARKTVKAQLVVDAVGRAAGIEITREDLGDEIAQQAMRLGRPAEEIAEFMTHPDRIGALVSDAFRRRSIDHLIEQVQVLSAPPEEEAGDSDAAADSTDPGDEAGDSAAEG